MDMVTLKDICEYKKPLKLKALLPRTQCPCGNAALLQHGDEDKYLCLFREFNYCFYERLSYEKRHDEFTTYGIWTGVLDNNFSPMYINIDALKIGYMDFQDSYGLKFEDPRLFKWNNNIYVSLTKVSNYDRFQNSIVVGRLFDNDFKVTIDIEYDSYVGYGSEKREKNWMPTVEPFKMIHSVNDTYNRIVDIKSNEIIDVQNKVYVPPKLFGNTNLLELDNGDIISIVHQKSYDFKYTHYFIVFDKDFGVKHISRKFTFDNIFGIEFASSIFYQNKSEKKKVCISVCEDDYFQYVYVVDAAKLMDFIYGTSPIEQIQIDSGFKLNVFSNDNIGEEIHHRKDFYESDILHCLDEVLPKGNRNVCLDIGANIGNHTVFFSKIMNFKQVHSFEPLQCTYNVLTQNVQSNNCGNVITHNIGISSQSQSYQIEESSSDNIGHTSFSQKDTGKYKFERLDNLNIQGKIDLVKIDVEGMENFVLEGGVETLRKNLPYVFVETFEDPKISLKILFDLGYEIIQEFRDHNYLLKHNG